MATFPSRAMYNTDDIQDRVAVLTANSANYLPEDADPVDPNVRRKSLSITNLSTVVGNYLLVCLSASQGPDKTIPSYQFRINIGDTWKDPRAIPYQGAVWLQFFTTNGEALLGYEE